MRTTLAMAMLLVVLLLLTWPQPAQSAPAPPVNLTPHAAPPAPVSDSFSPDAQRAVAFISQREGLPIEQLRIVNEFRRDHPLIQRTFQAVTVMNQADGRFFDVLVDRSSAQIADRVTIDRAVARAHRTK